MKSGPTKRKTKKRKLGLEYKNPTPETTPKIAAHYTADYIINPAHPVTVNVIGCGGNGSQVLSSLARMSSALIALGHPGLYVRAIDNDKVTAANMGRQLFSPADVGQYKCTVLIGRINRYFGYDWEGVPVRYDSKSKVRPANITISCVDTGASRREIRETLLQYMDKRKRSTATDYGYYTQRAPAMEPYEVPYYWMDFGNMMDRGQVVIGTVGKINQPKKTEHESRSTLPTIEKFHPDILIDKKREDQGPSCSLAEALGKQDLFINTNLTNMGLGILWKMFRELHIKYQGLYLNLQTLSVNPIKIK